MWLMKANIIFIQEIVNNTIAMNYPQQLTQKSVCTLWRLLRLVLSGTTPWAGTSISS